MKKRMITAILCAAIVLGCVPPEGFITEPERQWRSFGEEMFDVLRDEARFSDGPAAARVSALDARRDDVIWALNQLEAGGLGLRVLEWLESIVHLFDEEPTGRAGAMTRVMRRMEALVDGASDTQPLLDALARLGDATRPVPAPLLRLAGAMASMGSRLLEPLSAFLVEHDALVQEVGRDVSARLADVDPPEPGSSILARLLQPAPEWVDPPLRPAWAVLAPTSGGVPPFAPGPVADETRDADGRAFGADGEVLHPYVDLHRSTLAHVLDLLHRLVEDGSIAELPTALEPLLGPRTYRPDEQGGFDGYDGKNQPVDVWLAALEVTLSYDRLPELLAALAAIDEADPRAMSELLVGLADAWSRFADIDRTAPGSAIVDDLFAELGAMADARLMGGLLSVIADPRSATMGPDFALLTRTSGVALPTDTLTVRTAAQVESLSWGPDVVRDAEGVPDQPSALQQLVELFNDTWRAPYSLVPLGIDAPTLIVTESLSDFFIDAMAGRARLGVGDLDDEVTELILPAVDEFDSLHPSAEQIVLFVNHPQPLMGDPKCHQGFLLKDHRASALMTLQRAGALASARPLAELVSEAGVPGRLSSLFAMLHTHFAPEASTAVGTVSTGSGLVRIEEDLGALLGEGPFWPGLVRLAAAADGLPVKAPDGMSTAAGEIGRFAAFLFRGDPRLRSRAVGIPFRADGTDVVDENLSPGALVLHAVRVTEQAIDSDPDARAAWGRVDLAGALVGWDGAELTNAYVVPLARGAVRALADWASERITSHAGWVADLQSTRADVLDLVGSRAVAASMHLVQRLLADPSLRSTVEGFAIELVAWDLQGLGPRGAVLGAVAWLATLPDDLGLIEAASPWLSDVLAPPDIWLSDVISAVRVVLRADPEGVGAQLMARLGSAPVPARLPGRILLDAVEAVGRVAPGSTEPLGGVDLASALGAFADFMADEREGLERMFDIIRRRR